ncbi:MAG TPA: c-type cytochrome [Anaerolineales bacterium]|nr:c-type cytochrome [Anaerolineales bacterium]
MKFRLFLVLPAVLTLSACYSLAADITPPPGYVYTTPIASAAPTEALYFPFMPPDPRNGAAIYADRCIDCHGPAGLGDGPAAADLPNPVAPIGDPNLAVQRAPSDWFRMVTEGNIERYMPPFTSLTERQRWDVVAYAFSLSTTAEALAEGGQLYAENCAACHGPAGAGDGPDAASLVNALPDFTDQAAMADRSLNDLVAGMSHPNLEGGEDLAGGLTETMRLAVARHLRALTFATTGPLAAEPDLPPASEETASEADPAGEPGTPPDEIDDPAVNAAVTGLVTNLSGTDTPAGLEVILYGFDQFQQTFDETTTIEADGTFRFDVVEMPEGRAFLVAVEHQRGTYTSDLAVAGPVAEPIAFQVEIYDSTTDISALSIDRLHVFFEFISSDVVRVAELVLITNAGSEVVLPAEDGRPSLTFMLPPEAVNLQFEEGSVGSQFVLLPEGGFGDLRGVSPGVGSHQILFSFDMPYTRRFELDQVMGLPVSALVVLLPDTGVEIVGEGLVSGGVRDIEGRNYQLYTGGGIAAGAELPVALSGVPDVGGETGLLSSSAGLSIGVSVFGFVLIGLGVWIFRRGSRGREDSDAGEEAEPVPEHIHAMSREELMDAIIALDDRFKVGDLPEGAYLKQRSLLKGQLHGMLGMNH